MTLQQIEGKQYRLPLIGRICQKLLGSPHEQLLQAETDKNASHGLRQTRWRATMDR